MIKNLIILVCLLTAISSKPNLFIGTGGSAFACGSNSPAAQLPFSYVRLGPDTSPLIKKLYLEFQHFGGYSENDHAIKAFSHLRLVGAGVIDMGVYGVLPLKVKKGDKTPTIPNNPMVKFSKETEIA